MTVIARSRVESVDRGYYVSEASSLGLRPGQWPDRLVVDLGTEQGDGSPITFRLWRVEEQGGDVESALYGTTLGTAFLRVYND